MKRRKNIVELLYPYFLNPQILEKVESAIKKVFPDTEKSQIETIASKLSMIIDDN